MNISNSEGESLSGDHEPLDATVVDDESLVRSLFGTTCDHLLQTGDLKASEKPSSLEIDTWGARVGEYVLETQLGAGGFGAVYAARHARTHQRVAVKLLRPRWSTSSEMVLRLFREAESIRSIGHPNIVEIYDWGWLTERVPAIVMELLDGTSLLTLVEARGSLPAEEVLAYFEPVCDALAAAHRAGIVHRDIKASNVMIASSSGRTTVKLIDFGIAKLLSPAIPRLTRTGVLLGTPTAVAPEQLLGRPVDERTDIYALGVLLYHLLTGRRPFGQASAHLVEQMHLNAPAPRASHVAPVSLAVDRVILRAMEKDPCNRFESVAHFLDSLRAACEILEAGIYDGHGSSHPRTADGRACPEDEDRAEDQMEIVGVESEQMMPAIAISVALLRAGHSVDLAELDDEALDELQDHLELIQRDLEAHGFSLPVQTATEIMGCQLLERSDPEHLSLMWQEGLEIVGALVRQLRASSHFLEVAACIDLGAVRVRSAGGSTVPQIVGGNVIKVRTPTNRREAGLWASSRTLREPLAALDTEASWVLVQVA